MSRRKSQTMSASVRKRASGDDSWSPNKLAMRGSTRFTEKRSLSRATHSQPNKSRNWLECAKKTRRVANVNTRLSNVLRNNCPGADGDSITDRDRKNGGVCSNAYVIPKFCCSPSVRICVRTPANKRIIDEHGAMRNEAFVSNRYELTDERVRLNSASLPDRYSLLYFYEWSDEAVIANCASIEIDRLHDSYVFTERYIDDP